jgi:DNA-binding GntR family transcriptional regulator
MDPKLDFFAKFGSAGFTGMAKYALLRDAMLKAIEGGHWLPGEKLPAENQIAGATHFALGTVQRALRELVAEGIITRIQGHGSFVAEPRKPMDKPWHCRFLDDSGADFLPIFPKVLSVERIAELGTWSAFLEQRGDNVIRIDRRISINHEFSIYSRFYANADKFGTVLQRPFAELESNNLKMLLNQHFNLPITVVSQDLRFLEFPSAVCKVIEVKRGTVGLHIQAVASAGRSMHLYFQEWYIPPNKRTLRVVENSPIGNTINRDFTPG